MPRKSSQWQDEASSLIAKPKTVKDREALPEIACSKCKNFGPRQFTQDGTGWCKALKGGSDITTDPLIYVLTGDSAYLSNWNTDSKNCKYFTKMVYIDKNADEIADPTVSRVYRQMSK